MMTLGNSIEELSDSNFKKQFPPCENVRLAATLYHKKGNSAPGGPFTACLPRVITLDDLPGAPFDFKAGRAGQHLPKPSLRKACLFRPPFNLPVAKAGVTPCQTGSDSGAASLEGEASPEFIFFHASSIETSIRKPLWPGNYKGGGLLQ
jgi:hypothetical protein